MTEKKRGRPRGKTSRVPLPKPAFLRYCGENGITAMLEEVERLFPHMRTAALHGEIIRIGCNALLSAQKKSADVTDLEVQDASH
jgi:hypothetical protein